MNAAAELASFLARYDPPIAALARAARAELRQRLRGATELVYDNYNALVIGFGPSERPSEAIFSLVLYPRYVSLCFLQGAKLPDPRKRLRGKGKVVRHLRLASAATLDEPGVRSLMELALARAKVRLDPGARHRLVIRSISAKQRPRRPRAKAASRKA